MVRAMFLATGVILLLLGLQCVVVDEAVVHDSGVAILFADETAATGSLPATRVIEPPSWAPWLLGASGVVAMLYGYGRDRG